MSTKECDMVSVSGRTGHDSDQDHTPSELRESAYRRGFAQGLLASVKVLVSGGTLEDLLKYEDVIADWRFRVGAFRSDERCHVEHPPEPPVKKSAERGVTGFEIEDLCDLDD